MQCGNLSTGAQGTVGGPCTGGETHHCREDEEQDEHADTDRHAAFQRFHDALVEHFGPEEMLEIVGVVVNMNVWTRIKLAEGAMPGPAG